MLALDRSNDCIIYVFNEFVSNYLLMRLYQSSMKSENIVNIQINFIHQMIRRLGN